MKWFYFIFMGVFITVIITIFIIFDIKNSSGDYSKDLNKIINRKVKYDILIKIDYSNSGNMRGNVENLVIDISSHVIRYRYSEGFDIPVLVTEYSISDEDINNLNEMIKKYNFPAWSNLDRSDMIVYDASSKSISLSYDNSKIGGSNYVDYDIDYDTKIPSDGFILLNEFTDYMFSLLNDENFIDSYTEIEDY